MCLAVIALAAYPRFRAVIAANRDEFHARPAAPAHWWDECTGAGAGAGSRVLAGRDLQAGGTWLGITGQGRWAFVTNVREPARHDPQAPSRGVLVPAILRDGRDPAAALASTVAGAAGFNGFNVVAGDGLHAAFGSNRAAAAIQTLPPGLHGVSNAQLDTPWPKLARVKAGVARWIESGAPDPRALWEVLADRTIAPDAELPATGLPLERERLVSAPFIVSDTYGTRCSTIIALGRDGSVHFAERSFDPEGRITGEVTYRFEVGTAHRTADPAAERA